MQRSVDTWAGAGSPDIVTPTPTPVPRLPWGAAMSLRTSGRKQPRGFAAQRFARLGLLVVANAGTGSQKLLNNHTGFTSHSEDCITILPITGQTDYFAPNRGRQLDIITNHNSLGLVKGQANFPPITRQHMATAPIRTQDLKTGSVPHCPSTI